MITPSQRRHLMILTDSDALLSDAVMMSTAYYEAVDIRIVIGHMSLMMVLDELFNPMGDDPPCNVLCLSKEGNALLREDGWDVEELVEELRTDTWGRPMRKHNASFIIANEEDALAMLRVPMAAEEFDMEAWTGFMG